jgi:hypothetical protein
MADIDPRIEALDKRYQKLLGQRSPYEELWRQLIARVRPARTTPLVSISPGQSQMTSVFDSAPIHANETLAASMAGSLTNGATKWFRLRHRLEAVNQDPATQRWLDNCTTTCHKALQSSNFGSEGIEGYKDLGAFGIAAILMQENPMRPKGTRFGGMEFSCMSPGEYVVAEGAGGVVNTLFRTVPKTPAALVEQWPTMQAQDRIGQLLESDPDSPIDVVHAIVPQRQAQAGDKPFASIYYLPQDRTLISVSGYWEFPVLVPRWSKSSREVYGRGPGHTALPDINTLNRVVEQALRAADKYIDPPMKALDEGVLSSVRISPAGITYLRSMDALQILEAASPGLVQLAQLKVQDLQHQIKETFYNHQIQLPSQAYMTAEEVTKRYELMQRILGPTLGRLESEFLAPMIRRLFMTLFRAGMLPNPPDAVIKAQQAGFSEIDIEYEGPIAQSQRRSDVESIQRTIAVLSPLVQVKPEIIDNFDLDGLARQVATDNGVAASFLRTPDEINVMRQARAKVKAAAAQAQLQQVQSQTASNMGSALAQGAQAAATATDAAPQGAPNGG